jgi:cytochrome c oxidase assembly factor 6
MSSEKPTSGLSLSPALSQTSAPSVSQREECWKARDAYFECLDSAQSPEHTKCEQLMQKFNEACLPSWVRHFQRKREVDMRRAKLSGFIPKDA